MRQKLIIFLGVQLSGKTTLARKISSISGIPFIGLDDVRRKLYGSALSGPKDWVDQKTKEVEDTKVKLAYNCLFNIIESIIKSGGSIIIEMPWLGNRESQIEQIIKLANVDLKIIWCQIDNDSEEEIQKRSKHRQDENESAIISASNYLMFKAKIIKPSLESLVVDTSQPIETCLADIKKYLKIT